MNTTPTEQLTLSLTVNSRHSAKTIFEKLTRHPESCIIQEPIENEFAAFYAIVKRSFWFSHSNYSRKTSRSYQERKLAEECEPMNQRSLD